LAQVVSSLLKLALLYCTRTISSGTFVEAVNVLLKSHEPLSTDAVELAFDSSSSFLLHAKRNIVGKSTIKKTNPICLFKNVI
ncbi:MAG: hypothetical protein VX485_01255, partial [SAR324 cluster bacterium]|nr:hypothetical protein [SAR324 cluster bacterium]